MSVSPNDLRIGNKVYGGNPARCIATIRTIIQQGVEAGYQLITPGAVKDNPGIGFAKFEDIYPIPLTPEILEKCGFIDPAANGWGMRISVNSVDELAWFLQDEPPYGGEGGIIRYQTKSSGFTRQFKIRHLHQLQNLYFALTGEELEVKL